MNFIDLLILKVFGDVKFRSVSIPDSDEFRVKCSEHCDLSGEKTWSQGLVCLNCGSPTSAVRGHWVETQVHYGRWSKWSYYSEKWERRLAPGALEKEVRESPSDEVLKAWDEWDGEGD